MPEDKKVEVKLNIYQRMAKITEEVGFVKKGLTIQVTSEKSYQAVSEGDVLASVKPLEYLYGIYSYPISRIITEAGTVTNQYGKVSQFLRIETIYRFVNVDKPDEFVEVTTYGDGIDAGDKTPGKAMTYADKYALLKAYKIETGDDPDANPSEELKGKNEPKKEAKKPEVKTPKLIQPDQITILRNQYVGDIFVKFLEKNKIQKIEEMDYEVAKGKIDNLNKLANELRAAKEANDNA